MSSSFSPFSSKRNRWTSHPELAIFFFYRMTSALCGCIARTGESRAKQNRKISNCAGSPRVPHAFRHRLPTELMHITTRNPLNFLQAARREDWTNVMESMHTLCTDRNLSIYRPFTTNYASVPLLNCWLNKSPSRSLFRSGQCGVRPS